jgi:quinoprotein glucose dehydrogenase
MKGFSHTRRVLAALFCWTCASHGAALPEGVGKAEIFKVCSQCHTVDQAVSLRQGQAAWQETLEKMTNLGAVVSDADFDKILRYLVKFYRSADSAPAPTRSANAGLPASPSNDPSLASKSATTAARLIDGSVRADPAREWRTYGHDSGANRYSPLKQITPANVGNLKVAWISHMRPEGF